MTWPAQGFQNKSLHERKALKEGIASGENDCVPNSLLYIKNTNQVQGVDNIATLNWTMRYLN